jgi:hypothetical protein
MTKFSSILIEVSILTPYCNLLSIFRISPSRTGACDSRKKDSCNQCALERVGMVEYLGF